jgi:hypothetical protein
MVPKANAATATAAQQLWPIKERFVIRHSTRLSGSNDRKKSPAPIGGGRIQASGAQISWQGSEISVKSIT